MAASIDVTQFFQVFFDESEELLSEMESLLLAVDVSAPSSEECNAIFRTAHSIKGGAATFGLTDMAEVTHVMESLLDKIRKGEMALTDEHVNAFLEAKDVLRMQLDGHRQKKPVDGEAAADVLMLLRALSTGEITSMAPTASFAMDTVQETAKVETPVAEGMHHFRIELPGVSDEDARALTDELGLMGDASNEKLPDGRMVIRLDTNDKLDDVIAICSFVLNPEDLKITEGADQPAATATTALPIQQAPAQEEQEEDFGFFVPVSPKPSESPPPTPPKEPEIKPAPAPVPVRAAPPEAIPAQGAISSAHQESSSIRVNLEKVDQLINLVGELVITQAMIEQHAGGLDSTTHERLLNSFATLARNTRDLQEAVMSIRMMPMEFVFSRFPRMVRDLAGKLDKKVKLITLGGATELDKGLIERIVDPLTHLVRNSIDHGLEEPAIRLAAGKNEAGVLTLSAAHESGNIVVEVSDDGAGLNRERILAKAREQGIAVSEDMRDEEIWQLIFAPGFSTATVVTDVSGRGVGMDVVKRNIAAMGGSVDIRSFRGKGTTITISLPLTLAILEGMSIKTGDEIYILPLAAVVESLKPAAESIRDLTGKSRVIRVREEYMPLVPLHEVFGIQPKCVDPTEGIVVVLEADGKKAALFVDSLVGQQQVVVKNLESNYRRMPGISGATILGDGNVSLILDVPSLLRASSQAIPQQPPSPLTPH